MNACADRAAESDTPAVSVGTRCRTTFCRTASLAVAESVMLTFELPPCDAESLATAESLAERVNAWARRVAESEAVAESDAVRVKLCELRVTLSDADAVSVRALVLDSERTIASPAVALSTAVRVKL